VNFYIETPTSLLVEVTFNKSAWIYFFFKINSSFLLSQLTIVLQISSKRDNRRIYFTIRKTAQGPKKISKRSDTRKWYKNFSISIKLNYLIKNTSFGISELQQNMEQPQLSNSTENLLNNRTDPDPDLEEAHNISLEFIKQNEIISKEILKHDQLLRTCPMIVLRTWILLYTIYGFIGSLFLLIFVPNFNPVHQMNLFLFYSIIYFTIFAILYSIYGNLLLWRGISARDLFKIEKSLSIFKFYLSFLTIGFLFALAYQIVTGTWTWASIGGCVSTPIPILINLLLANYVRKILREREVFCRVSSDHNNKK